MKKASVHITERWLIQEIILNYFTEKKRRTISVFENYIHQLCLEVTSIMDEIELYIFLQ